MTDIEKFLDEQISEEKYLGMAVLIFTKGGEGPEGVQMDCLKDVEAVPNFTEKLRKLADELDRVNM